MRKAEWILLLMVAISFALGAWAFPYVPMQVAVHWDTAGNANGMMARTWGLFLGPMIFLATALLLIIIPRMDPRRDHILEFRRYFDYFIVGFGVVLLCVQVIAIVWNLGVRFNFAAALVPPLAAMVYLVGVILPRTESNFTLGVRTPWTLSSEVVWKKTHSVAGILCKASAFIALLGMVFPAFIIWFFIVPLAITAGWVVIYSYYAYTRERA